MSFKFYFDYIHACPIFSKLYHMPYFELLAQNSVTYCHCRHLSILLILDFSSYNTLD